MTSHPLPIIELRDISLCYDSRERPVLEDINLGIHRGDFVAITGPNGGGKTSLLRIILRLLKPSSGQVIYRRDNRDVRCLPIGYLPQKSMIDARFPITVREVILSGLLKNMWGRYNADDIRRLNYIMELTGTSAVAHHPIGELSGGQLQRTLLGRAIISDPEILVLDEPLSYVDKAFEQHIYGIVEELSQHTTIILVSHEMTVISSMANRHLIVDHTLKSCPSAHHHITSPCDATKP